MIVFFTLFTVGMGCGSSVNVEEEEKEAAVVAPISQPEKSVAEAESAVGREKREESIVEVHLSTPNVRRCSQAS